MESDVEKRDGDVKACQCEAREILRAQVVSFSSSTHFRSRHVVNEAARNPGGLGGLMSSRWSPDVQQSLRTFGHECSTIAVKVSAIVVPVIQRLATRDSLRYSRTRARK